MSTINRGGGRPTPKSGLERMGSSVRLSLTHIQFHHIRKWQGPTTIKETINFQEVFSSLSVSGGTKVWKNSWLANYTSPKVVILNVIKVATTSNWVTWQMIESWIIRREANLRKLTKTDKGFSSLSVRDWRESWRQMPTTFDLSKTETKPSTFFFLLSFTGASKRLQRISCSSEHDVEDFLICYSLGGVCLKTYFKHITTCLDNGPQCSREGAQRFRIQWPWRCSDQVQLRAGLYNLLIGSNLCNNDNKTFVTSLHV